MLCSFCTDCPLVLLMLYSTVSSFWGRALYKSYCYYHALLCLCFVVLEVCAVFFLSLTFFPFFFFGGGGGVGGGGVLFAWLSSLFHFLNLSCCLSVPVFSLFLPPTLPRSPFVNFGFDYASPPHHFSTFESLSMSMC